MRTVLKHTHSAFSLAPSDLPFHRMLFGFLATCTPLIIGFLAGHTVQAILVSLLGHFLFVLDIPRALPQRILQIVGLGLLFMGSVFVGCYLRQWPLTFTLLFCLGVYGMGLSVNISKFHEMAALLGLVNVIIGYYADFLKMDAIIHILKYDLFYLIIMSAFVAIFHYYSPPKEDAPVPEKPHSSFKTFHLYSFSFALATYLGFVFLDSVNVPKPYWVIITLLVVFRPERKISIYRLLQRLMGTLLGIVVASVVFQIHFSMGFLIVFIGVVSLLLPYGMVKNYWLGTFFITLMVIGLLSVPVVGKNALLLSQERFWATLYGLALVIIGLTIYEVLWFITPKRLSK